jgi:uncharacterized protein YgbK (DUF1537 family)
MLYTFYGDDFTGSTDVLEALARAGVPAVLFLAPPNHEDLAQFPGVQAIGIAGDSRSRSPEWMNANLPAIFQALKKLDAPIAHYKTCSTFDSAPHIGNIGRAMELGIATFHPRFVPIVVGAPHLGRYVILGKLYAKAGNAIYRIDEHPTMKHHPVTPMLEPDLRKHLAKQTDLPIASLDIRDVSSRALLAALEERPAAVLFDGFDEATLETTGRIVWRESTRSRVMPIEEWKREIFVGTRPRPLTASESAGQPTLFAVGSSGLTASLIQTWRHARLIRPISSTTSAIPVAQLLVVSGSCSPITQSQIEWALANGFHGIPLDPAALLTNPSALTSALDQTLAAIAANKSPILYTALGPLSASTPPHTDALGSTLGLLVEQIIRHSPLRRVVLCGGDTSSHAIQRLPIKALTALSCLAPGAPLCRAHSPDPAFHNAEFVLKGGQIGPLHFFERVRRADPL